MSRRRRPRAGRGAQGGVANDRRDARTIRWRATRLNDLVEAAERRLAWIEREFDNRCVEDSAPPSPATVAALEACAAAMVEERAAHARTLDAVAALGATDAVPETGHRSLSRLLAEHLRLDPAEARRLLRHASLLVAGAVGSTGPTGPAEPDLPASARAARDGAVSPGHVEVIDKTVTRLRRVVPSLPPEVVEESERQLAGLAGHRSPGQLADAAHEILLRHDPDGEAPHDADRPAEELRMHTGRDGVLTGRFRFAEPEAAEVIRSAIEARTPIPEPDADTTALRPGRELHERRGEALRVLVDDAGVADPDHDCDACAGPDDLADPANPANSTAQRGELRIVGDDERDIAGDSAPAAVPGSDARSRRDRPSRETTVIVTVPLDVLTGAGTDRGAEGPRAWQGTRQRLEAGFGLLDGRWAITAATARRLACDAAVIPAVLGSTGEPLDLGRRTRVVSAAQRRAVVTRDRHCAHPGCRRSPRRCDVHHVVPWFLDGPSDLDNLVLLCPYHHHQQYHSGWSIDMRAGVPWFVPPAWLDPLRTPRSNHRTADAS